MWRAVDEVCEAGDGGGEADDGAVEPEDDDLGVCGEGVRDVKVEGDEALEVQLVSFFGVTG